MENYTCEDASVCTRYQSAICLHCNCRLCLFHITEHNKIIVSSVTNLSTEINTTFQQIKEESEKRKFIFNSILTSFDQWRTEQIEKIQQIYEKHLNLIESQREVLNNTELKLIEQLQQNALQPLEHIQRQQNANMEIITHIQQTVKQVREDNSYMKWKLVTSPPPVDIEYSRLNIPSISVKSTMEKNISSTEVVQQPNGHPFKRLFQVFSDISNIEKSKYNIADHVKRQGKNFELPNFICSYLTAWYKKTKIDEKIYLLNQHIKTVQNYLKYRKDDLDVLFGIQVFFYNKYIKENKKEMMAFLLQFFLSNGCINQRQILKWYNHKGGFRYGGFNQAKQLASSFVKSLSGNQIVNDIPTNPTSAIQSHVIEIKQEPMATT